MVFEQYIFTTKQNTENSLQAHVHIIKYACLDPKHYLQSMVRELRKTLHK